MIFISKTLLSDSSAFHLLQKIIGHKKFMFTFQTVFMTKKNQSEVTHSSNVLIDGGSAINSKVAGGSLGTTASIICVTGFGGATYQKTETKYTQ